MLRHFVNRDPTPVDDQIAAVTSEMTLVGVDSVEYPTLLQQLERLYEIKAKNRRPRISRDTVVIVVGNLLGIIIIVAYEQKHAWTSKAVQINRPIEPK